jgi:hypothetical protein
LSEAVVWYNGDAASGGGTNKDEPDVDYITGDVVDKMIIKSSSSGTSEITDDENELIDESYKPASPRLPPRSDSAGRTRSSKRINK